MQNIQHELNDLMGWEEIHWKQRSRVTWLQEGDQNTKYFHTKASQRRQQNTIAGIHDSHGTCQTDPEQIREIILGYYRDIFTSEGSNRLEEVMESVERRVTPEMNNMLTKPFQAEEVFTALQQMHPS